MRPNAHLAVPVFIWILQLNFAFVRIKKFNFKLALLGVVLAVPQVELALVVLRDIGF